MNKPLVNEHMGGGRKESGERQAGRNKLRARLMVHVEGSVCRVRSAEPGLQGRCSTVSPGSSGGCSNLGNVDFLSYPSTPPSPNPNRAVDATPIGCRKEPMLSSCLSGYLHRWAGQKVRGTCWPLCGRAEETIPWAWPGHAGDWGAGNEMTIFRDGLSQGL